MPLQKLKLLWISSWNTHKSVPTTYNSINMKEEAAAVSRQKVKLNIRAAVRKMKWSHRGWRAEEEMWEGYFRYETETN